MSHTVKKSLAAIIFLGLATPSPAQVKQKPNIIFILADDLGYGDVGCYGQRKIATPNIDQLAREGVSLTDFYAGAPVCSPSRGVLLTGRNTGHATIRGNMTITGGTVGYKNGKEVHRASLQPGETTLGHILQKSGYHTALMGKWHLGGYDTTATPLNFGFDEFSGWLISRPETYTSTYWPDHWFRNGKVEEIAKNSKQQRGYYVSELITDDAISYMETHKEDERPFFLMVNHSNPHSPLDAPQNSLYDSVQWSADEKTYAAMVTYLDQSVGRIREFVTANSMQGNTIIIFTSDNGPRSEPKEVLTHIAEFFNSAGPLRGYKRDVTEGGIRVPMLVWSPSMFKAGSKVSTPGYFADMLPTLASIGQSAIGNVEHDGIDLLPAIKGDQPYGPDRYLYWEFFEGGFVQAVRFGKWKAIKKEQKLALFDLSTDIDEQNDIASSHPDIAGKIETYLKTCRSESAYWPLRSQNLQK